MKPVGGQKRKRRVFKGSIIRQIVPESGIFRLQPSPRSGAMLGGRYEILGLVDRGGTSEVYLARDSRGPLTVIVKMLTDEAAKDPQHRERFIAGAKSVIPIIHPAIGRVYSVYEAPNTPPYLVMEALQGESLADYLNRETTMSASMTLTFAREAASGLVAAHSAGIIHRDIKPGNVYLLGPNGSPTSLKLIDFGLSKDLRNTTSGPASVNMVLGTAQYMAPEQVLADPVDARTDIYAFGVLLFRMLTGQLPFDLELGADLFSHQLFSPAPPPSWLVEDINPRLERMILRCLRKHPDNRYASMQQVLDELVAIAEGNLDELHAATPPLLECTPDVYVCHSANGRSVATDLAQHFGEGGAAQSPTGENEQFELFSTLQPIKKL